MLERIMSAVGVVVMTGMCVLISENRRRISWRIVGWGLGLQFLFALLILKTWPDLIFNKSQAAFDKLYSFAGIGAAFLFGELAKKPDFVILMIASVVIFVSSLMAVLYYLRIIQAFVFVFAKIMQRTMKISGAESLSSAMFVFMGIEAVTGLKNYLRNMTRSELMTLMSGFMATIAGSVMATYVALFHASAGHILAASLMSAPAAVMLSKILVPETGEPATAGRIEWAAMRPEEDNIIEAAANGAIDGVKLAAFIGAMMLAFISLVHFADYLLGFAHTSFTQITSYLFAPFAFVMGVPWKDCLEVGNLLGVKVIFNEWISFQQLGGLAASGAISPRANMITTYALCGFANFGSLGILIGGVSALVPERKKEVAALGMKSLLAGMLASFLTAAVAGLLVWK